jgi:hypothetical protein
LEGEEGDEREEGGAERTHRGSSKQDLSFQKEELEESQDLVSEEEYEISGGEAWKETVIEGLALALTLNIFKFKIIHDS